MKNKKIRKDDEAVSPVIAVILMVAITVVLSGVLYVWVSGFGFGDQRGSFTASALVTEKNEAYVVTISSTSGGSLNSDEFGLQITDEFNRLIIEVSIADANPMQVISGESIMYPIPSGNDPVTDSTGNALDGDTPLNKFTNCTIVYIDQNNNGRLNSDDSFWIYKDNDADNTEEITSKYTFKIVDGNEKVVLKKSF